MRMSCNGCRVLRKGCSEDCIIRPCLHWIKNPESQAHATVFLAKFYGRAGLINLINAGPDKLRPGLLWSGSWQMCQAAVDAVLNGKPIVAVNEESHHHHQLNPYDIRHVGGAGADLHKVARTSRTRFKKSRHEHKAEEFRGAESHESSGNDESLFSAEEASHVSQAEPSAREEEESGGPLELDLTLGFEPAKPAAVRAEPERTRVEMMDGWDDEDTCEIQLGLELRS